MLINSERRPQQCGTRVLAGDIGGTNSRLAIYGHDTNGLSLVVQRTYASHEYSCLTEVIAEFLDTVGGHCDAVCLGLPGPIFAGDIVSLTNLPWRIEHGDLRRVSRTESLFLMNDVEASAAGVNDLRAEDLVCLHSGDPDSQGNRVVISIGTGLGVAGITPSGRTFATEAGHATFSPRTDFDFRLMSALTRDFGHVSWERVTSGPGLPIIYSRIAKAENQLPSAAEIVGRSATDPLCHETVATFRRYVGTAAGNIALTLMATGGIFFAGGVSPEIMKDGGADPVLAAFFDKGRMQPLLEQMPIHLVVDENLALNGAARTAIKLLNPP